MISCAKHSLREIVPESSEVINKGDYDLVFKLLCEWESALYKKINVTVGE